jgi:hypothetical protein
VLGFQLNQLQLRPAVASDTEDTRYGFFFGIGTFNARRSLSLAFRIWCVNTAESFFSHYWLDAQQEGMPTSVGEFLHL